MPAPRKNYDDAVEMYKKGLSVGDVAIPFGMSRQAMWKILKRRDVLFRSNIRWEGENHFYRGGSERNVNFVVTKAVQKGILIVEQCECCGLTPAIVNGRQRIHGHHDDYNHLLKVRWLCQKCHHEWHKHNSPKLRMEEMTPHKEVSSMGGKASWGKHRPKLLMALAEARKKVKRNAK